VCDGCGLFQLSYFSRRIVRVLLRKSRCLTHEISALRIRSCPSCCAFCDAKKFASQIPKFPKLEEFFQFELTGFQRLQMPQTPAIESPKRILSAAGAAKRLRISRPTFYLRAFYVDNGLRVLERRSPSLESLINEIFIFHFLTHRCGFVEFASLNNRASRSYPGTQPSFPEIVPLKFRSRARRKRTNDQHAQVEYWDRRSRPHLFRRGQQSVFLQSAGRNAYADADSNTNCNTCANAKSYGHPDAHADAYSDADFSMHRS